MRTYIIAHPVTKIKRRVYSRRKHLYNWPTYFNLLTRWSADYRFRLKYLSALIEPNLFIFRYLTFNQASIHSKNYSFFKINAEFKSVAITRNIKNYFSTPSRPLSLPRYFNSFLHLTTWKAPQLLYLDNSQSSPSIFLKSAYSFYNISTSPIRGLTPNHLSLSIFQFYLKYIKSIYRISTLLILSLLL